MPLRVAAVVAIAALSAGFGAVEARAAIKPFQPVADAHVSKAKSQANFGGSKRLVVDGSPVVRSYLRFNVRGLGGTVSYATLQLSALSASSRRLIVRRASRDHWGEKRIRFGNAPKLVGPTAKARGVKSFRTTNIDVTPLVRGNGVVTLVLSARGRGGATFWSSEAIKALRPALLVGVNEAPVCQDVLILTSEDTAGFDDPDCDDSEHDRMTYHIVSQGAHGRASVVDGKLRYIPRADANGVDRFRYRAKDGRKFSKAVTALVSIKSINDAPTCAPRTLTVNEDGGGAVGHLCSDVDGDGLTVSITSGAQNGTSTVVAGELRYTPNANTNGADAFTYRARDTTLASAPATVSVFVNPVNDAPTCGNISVTTFEDVPGDVNPSCSDIDGDALAYGIAGHGAKGTGSVIGGTLRFSPTANLNGPDAFTYFASDGRADSPPATVSVGITPVNDAPICQAISFETPEDQPRDVNPNCIDVEGDAMTYTIVSPPTRGSASVTAGKLRYVPNPNVTGPDAFSYRATDGNATGGPAAASVLVGPVNDPPVCTARTITLDEDDIGVTAPLCSDPENDTLTFAISAQGTKGVATIQGGNLQYDPAPNANGADTFTYRASDGGALSAAVAVNVTIRPVNDDPVCANVTLLTSEDVTAERAPSCSDIDNDPLTYSIVAQGTRGTASVVAGRLRYVPAGDQNGADSFTYRANDGTASSPPATTSVTIAAVNDAPTCSPVSVTTIEDVPSERDPSCSDVDGNPLTYSIVTVAGMGTASVTAASKLRYVPNANANGSDSFTYRATDGTLQSAPATASVSITAVNDAPQCSNASLASAEDEASEVVPSCTDVDSDALVFSIFSQPAKGTASVVAGKLRYVPDANNNGADSFTFRAADGTAFSAVATASVSVTAVNDAPVCSPVSITLDEDGDSTVPARCSDAEGDALTFSIASQGSKGTASVVGSNLRYVANPNAAGLDQFTYRARDASATGAPATATVSIGAVNDPPTCTDRTLTVNEDAAYGTVAPLCTDPENDPLTYAIAAQGTKGTASVVDGQLRYTPSPNANGADTFTYVASDPALSSAPATVSVTIQAVNDPPVAQNLSATTPEDTAKDVTLAATDVEGNPISFTIVASPTHGTLSGSGANRTYTPDANYNGPDSFMYQANDGTSDSNVATVALTVTAVNDPPVAQNVSVDTPENTPKNVTLAATDVESNPLSFSIVTPPTHGTLSGTGANRTYTPDANYNGPDSFTYKANDGGADSNVATVSVAVTAVNDPPVARDVSVTTPENVPATAVLDGNDVDGDPITYTIVSGPTNGVLAGTGSTLTYTPNLNYNGPDSFTYKVNDGTMDSNVATVTITVTPVNNPPIAQDLTSSTPEDTSKGVVLSATDVDGDILGFTIVTPPTHGGLFGGGANRSYTPDPNYNGPDSFTYKANDGAADSNIATVTLTVTPVNDAPSCPAQSLTIAEDSEGSVTPVCSDPEGESVSLEIVGQGLKGTASVVGNALRYVANANATGADSFTYRATDGALFAAPATVSVTISPANDSPVCAPVDLATSEDTTGKRDPFCTDIEGDELTYSIVEQGAKGTASVVAGKQLRYVPNPNATGADSFTYRATDGGGLSSAPATVSVTISAVNDAPSCSDAPLAATEETPAERDPVCSDIDSGTLTYAIVASGTKGSASVVAGKLRYVPNPNATGTDSFTYRANDTLADSNIATVSVTIAAVNDPPVARDVSVITPEDVPAAVSLDADDVDGDSLGYTIVSGPTHGVLAGTGATRTYTPNLNYSGSDSFTYKVNDGTVDSNVATVSITVTSTNDPPVAQDLTTSTAEDTSKALTLSATDAEGAVLGYTIVSGPTHGTLTGTGPNRTYTPNANYNGPDSFTYKANDGGADSNVATVTLNVTPVNDGPTCPAQSLTINEDTDGSVTPVCTDPEGDPFTLEVVSQALDGTASVVGSSLRFVPFVDANGPDSFTYRGRDSSAAPGPEATVSVTVNPVNDEPEATPIDTSTDKGVAKVITLTGFDFDNDPLTFRIVSLPANGDLRAGPDATDPVITPAQLPFSLSGNQVRYEPNAGFTGVNTFQFRAHDGAIAGLPADVQITVVATNVAPVCSNRTLNVDEDLTLTDTVCSDADGDSLTFTRTGPANGQLTLFDDGSFQYSPDQNSNGPDSFTVVARDPSGLTSALATVNITVAPVNDAPVCRPVVLSTAMDTPGTTFPDCEDVDGNPLTYEIVAQPLNGAASVNGPQLGYVPAAGYTGPDSFTYRAGDGTAFSGPATVSVNVTP